MNSIFKSVAAPLMMATALAGCESQVDIDRKPAVAASLIQDSIANCNVENPAIFRERLKDIMMDVGTVKLEFLKNNNVVVCLDSRQAAQETGFMDKDIYGIFYPAARSTQIPRGMKPLSIVGLWDNGKPMKDDSFLGDDASDYGSETLSELIDNLESNGIPSVGDTKFAARYSYKCGKSTCYEIKWKSGENFDQATQRKNPQLMEPPTPAQW